MFHEEEVRILKVSSIDHSTLKRYPFQYHELEFEMLRSVASKIITLHPEAVAQIKLDTLRVLRNFY